jgi:hypothetical protein
VSDSLERITSFKNLQFSNSIAARAGIPLAVGSAFVVRSVVRAIIACPSDQHIQHRGEVVAKSIVEREVD